MRKIFIISILLLVSFFTLKAQTENKGDFEIGGSTRAGISLNFESDFINASFNPFIGYYLTNKLVLGAGVSMYHIKNEYLTYTNYSFGPFLKYYFLESERFRPYLKFQTGIGQYISKYNYSSLYSNSRHTSSSYSLNTGAGISYWLKPSIALTTELSYGYYGYENRRLEDNSLNLNFGLQFKLGR